MQRAVRVVDTVAIAQHVEVVLLARVQVLGHAQRVENAVAYGVDRRHVEPCELGVEEADVERGVVDDQLGAANEVDEFGGNVGKARLVLQEVEADSVHRQRALVDVAIGVEIAVKVPVGQPPVAHLDAADFDDAVPELVLKAGRFGIEEDLSHACLALDLYEELKQV